MRLALTLFLAVVGLGAALRSPKDGERSAAAGAPMAAVVVLPPATSVLLSWTYGAGADAFELYGCSNLNVRLRAWTHLTNFPGTNRTGRWPMNQPQFFFTLAASNRSGVSDPAR
jgi:hypothetical protein